VPAAETHTGFGQQQAGQNTVRVDEDEEEESEVTQEAQAGMGGGDQEQEETRGQEADEEKMEKAGERGGEKKKGDAPQESSVTNKKRVGVKEGCGSECLKEKKEEERARQGETGV